MTTLSETTDVLIIGGGFFGLYVAEHLRKQFRRVTVCESGRALMARASLHNQARVHKGYHYSRSILTGLRCRVHYRRFIEEFSGAIFDADQSHYAIGRVGSNVSARQFELFCDRIGAPLWPAEDSFRELFDPDLIENVYRTEELAFDSVILRGLMEKRVEKAGVDVRIRTNVERMEPVGTSIRCRLTTPSGAETVDAGMVLNCTYSSLNEVLAASGLPLVALKHELAELCLVRVPQVLEGNAITVMCGPFFSVVRFPSRSLYTLSHVRYTPHCSWHDQPDSFEPTRDVFANIRKKTRFPHMVRDAARYLPILAECEYVESLFEVKTVLPMTETDDSRPILFLKHHGLPNHHLILGAKIDNVYDVVAEIDHLLASGDRPTISSDAPR